MKSDRITDYFFYDVSFNVNDEEKLSHTSVCFYFSLQSAFFQAFILVPLFVCLFVCYQILQIDFLPLLVTWHLL